MSWSFPRNLWLILLYHPSPQHAAKIAEDFSEQKVQDAVVTVPVYFNQVRRLSHMNFINNMKG